MNLIIQNMDVHWCSSIVAQRDFHFAWIVDIYQICNKNTTLCTKFRAHQICNKNTTLHTVQSFESDHLTNLDAFVLIKKNLRQKWSSHHALNLYELSYSCYIFDSLLTFCLFNKFLT